MAGQDRDRRPDLKPPPVTRYGALTTVICAAAFLCLAVIAAIAHQKSWIISSCAAAALVSLAINGFQRRALHDKAARQASEDPPAP